MRLARFVILLSMLFPASLALAQKVEPTNLTLVAVPGYSSPQQGVAFTNTGNSEITLTISITGPFSIPKNQCGRGVKPGTHCNIYVVYTPTGIETDTGTLGFTFNEQTVSVALTGNGVSIIPTSFAHYSYSFSHKTENVVMFAEGYVIPNGEQVLAHCIDYIDESEIWLSGTLTNNKAAISFADYYDDWQCALGYYGDAEFAGAGTHNFMINQCRPVKSCHGN